MSDTHKIVIIGTGFGGMYAMKSIAASLKNKEVEITLIGKENYFLFTPMLHEVATGALSHHNAAVAVRELLPKKGVDFVMTEVKSIDRGARLVHTLDGDIGYDTLIIATGASTQYFGVKGAKEHALQLKTLRDALHFRARLIKHFEKAAMEKDKVLQQRMLCVTIVGAGATGVELAAETAELVFRTLLPKFGGKIRTEDVCICLVHRGENVLGMFDAGAQKSALQSLREKGVDVRLKTAVVEVTEDAVHLGDGSRIDSDLVVWVAGVAAHVPDFVPPLPALAVTSSGQIAVDSTLRTPDDEHIYVIGDAAAFAGEDGKQVPMLAQVAMREGKYLGDALKERMLGRTPKPFVFQNLGELVSVGQWRAVGTVLGIPVRGPIGWMLWKMVYLTKFVSFPKALKIMLDWSLSTLGSRDVSVS